MLVFYCDKARHLVCKPFSVENLHKMALILNIDKCWFHNTKGKPHYDIPKLRIKEIMSRCIIVSSKEILNIIKNE